MNRSLVLLATACAVAVGVGVVGIVASGTDDNPGVVATRTSRNPHHPPVGAGNVTHHPSHHAHKVLVPNLIGQSAQAAHDGMEARGVHISFAPFRQDCDRIPSGQVVSQVPSPGEETSHPTMEAWTNVEATCGQLGLGGHPCPASQLSLKADGAESGFPGTGGEISFEARIKNRGSARCRLDSTLQLAVQREGSLDTAIRGNPASLHIRWGLRPRQTLTAEWLWPLWCGPRGPVVVVAEFAGLSDSDQSRSPACIRGEGRSSVLMGADI